jgi:hypothetical protein
MKCLSHLSSRFKASVPPTQEDIEQHLCRLNELLLLYQRLKTMTATELIATEREIEMELQWFNIHRLKLTSTSYPTAVHSADTIGLKSQLTKAKQGLEQAFH